MRTIIYTDIATDGMFTGPNLRRWRSLARTVPADAIIASGGVATLEHIESLCATGRRRSAGAIVGKAIYDGKLTVADAIKAATSPRA